MSERTKTTKSPKVRKRAERVKPVSRAPRFAKLRAMKCFPEVHQKIVEGWPISEVARFIQQDKCEYDDVSEGSLIQALHDYRSSIPAAELVARRMPHVFVKAAEEVQEGLDELAEYQRLYRLQMERIGIDHALEKKVNKLLGTTGQEIRIAREILSDFAELKMDLGLNERHLGKVDAEVSMFAAVSTKHGGTPAVAQVLSNPNSRRKVLALAEKFLSYQKHIPEQPPSEAVVDAEVTPPATEEKPS